MSLTIDYQTEELGNDERFPSEKRLQRWLETARATLAIEEALELTIRLVDNDEMQELNREYRGKDYPTNVLSFPCDWDLRTGRTSSFTASCTFSATTTSKTPTRKKWKTPSATSSPSWATPTPTRKRPRRLRAEHGCRILCTPGRRRLPAG